LTKTLSFFLFVTNPRYLFSFVILVFRRFYQLGHFCFFFFVLFSLMGCYCCWYLLFYNHWRSGFSFLRKKNGSWWWQCQKW
jgi:hypothetical protein